MGLKGTRTYVGFGFGAIQAGLFLHEACLTGVFDRMVVAEVAPGVVTALRKAGGWLRVNIAHADQIEQAEIGPIEIEDPAQAPDRQRLIEAIAAAEEIGTAIPSVDYYVTAGPGSLHRVLTAGLRRKATRRGPRAVVYTAENHNHAAELLAAAVLDEIPVGERDAVRARVRFLNTVIGKMSGVVTDPAEVRARGLTPITPGGSRAFLVEAFNRILISQIRFEERGAEPPFRRGLAVFEEKPDLLPFEEAKLYGHNATHAVAAYVGMILGVPRIAELCDVPGMMAFLRAAFVEESGAALIRRHAGVDPLFTPEGYAAYADDLLARMTNPYLGDTADRVGRDPARKLGWDDRLVGTMRVALSAGITPRRYALGAAAALATIHPALLERDAPAEALLTPLWREAAPAASEQQRVVELIDGGLQLLRSWRAAGRVPAK